MPSMNQLQIIGHVGNEPEMRFTPTGKPVTTFSVATNHFYVSADGERKKDTEWFTCVCWGRLAENCNQFVTKGSLVYAVGRVKLHEWQNSDGETRRRNEIQARSVIFLNKQASGVSAFDDEIPEDSPF